MKSWNSLHNVAIPSLVAFIEAGWVWAWFSAAANLSKGVPADIPFLALAVPAILAVVLSGLAARLPWAWWYRAAIVIPLAVLAIGVCAGAIGSLYEHGSFSVFALHPWTLKGPIHDAEGAVAWIAAVLAIGRGTWLGCRELTVTDAVRSVGLSTIAYIVFFVISSLHRGPGEFHPNVGVAGALLLVSFPAAIAVVALVNERELERTTLRRERSRPSLAWLGAVIVPMAIVAVVGALLALVVGPLASPIGRAIRALVTWIGDLLNDLAHLFKDHGHPSNPSVRRVVGPHPLQVTVAAPTHLPIWLTVLAAVISFVIIAFVMIFLLREVRRFRLRRHRSVGESMAVAEEKESVFSWSHLLDQLFGLFRRWFGRDRDRGAPAGTVAASLDDVDGGVESVRRHYRRVLVAARSAGYGRNVAETTSELKLRLATVTDAGADVALTEMTYEYELVRYGEEPDQIEQLERVRLHADTIVAVLENTQTTEQ